MDRRDVYREKLEGLFKEWKTKIGALEEKTEKMTSDLRSEMVNEIRDLKEKRKVVQDKWTEMQKVSGDTWDSVRGRTEKAVADMRSALDRVWTRRK